MQIGAVAKSYMRKGFLIYEEMRKYLVIYAEAVSHIWLCNRSTLNFLIYVENFFVFLFYQCTKNLPPGLDPCGQGRFAVWPLGASQSSPLASTPWHVPARQPAVVVGGDPNQSENRKSACCCCGWLGPDQSEDCNRKLGLLATSFGVPGLSVFGLCMQAAAAVGSDPNQSENSKIQACSVMAHCVKALVFFVQVTCRFGWFQSYQRTVSYGLPIKARGVQALGLSIHVPCRYMVGPVLANQRTVRYRLLRNWPMASKP